MRPKKNLLLYHPSANSMKLYRYAIGIMLPFKVHIASSIKHLRCSGPDFDLTLLWCRKGIEISNHLSSIFRTLPLTTTNYDLMEAIRIGAARKRGPKGK